MVEIIDNRNKELASKKDLRLGFVVIVGMMGAGFGYVVSILNTIIGKI